MHLCRLSQLTPRTVAWLWPGRLALGKLAILEGDPGLGKSLLALDLCARLSTGRAFPGEHTEPILGTAIVLNAEDGEEDTTRPRLEALGADLDRIFVPHLDEDHGLPLRLPEQTALLDDALSRTRARLVVLDPIVAFLDSSVCVNSDQGARRALLPLARLAEKHACVMLLHRHLNKKGAGRSLYRGSGSIGVLGACRSGWLVARDPEQPERRVLAQVKNNLAPPQPSLAFTMQARAGASPQLSWLGDSPLSADDLLTDGPRGRGQPSRDRATAFVEALLQEGPRTSREIWEAAREQGLAERTLYRARRHLEVRVQRVQEGVRQLYYWLLPGQQLPATLPTEAGVPDLEEWLAPLREQFPPSTPLDDL